MTVTVEDTAAETVVYAAGELMAVLPAGCVSTAGAESLQVAVQQLFCRIGPAGMTWTPAYRCRLVDDGPLRISVTPDLVVVELPAAHFAEWAPEVFDRLRVACFEAMAEASAAA